MYHSTSINNTGEYKISRSKALPLYSSNNSVRCSTLMHFYNHHKYSVCSNDDQWLFRKQTITNAYLSHALLKQGHWLPLTFLMYTIIILGSFAQIWEKLPSPKPHWIAIFKNVIISFQYMTRCGNRIECLRRPVITYAQCVARKLNVLLKVINTQYF